MRGSSLGVQISPQSNTRGVDHAPLCLFSMLRRLVQFFCRSRQSPRRLFIVNLEQRYPSRQSTDLSLLLSATHTHTHTQTHIFIHIFIHFCTVAALHQTVTPGKLTWVKDLPPSLRPAYCFASVIVSNRWNYVGQIIEDRRAVRGVRDSR